jgi:hypothetical protein
VPPPTEVAQRRHTGLGDQDDVPAVATVAAIRTSSRHVGLAAEGPGAIAAITCRHVDADVVSEHGRPMIATRVTGAACRGRRLGSGA